MRLLWILIAAPSFIALHGADGGRLALNPDSIVSLREPLGEGRFGPGTHCVITLSTGTVLAVREGCDEVLRVLGRPPI